MNGSGEIGSGAWLIDLADGVATVQPGGGELAGEGALRTEVLSCGTRIEWLSLPDLLKLARPA